MSKPVARKINGVFLLNKPLGISSNQALQRVKRLFAAQKAGHTGSLDPLATGMLPICFGEATKISQYLLDSDKYYRVAIQLGIRTTTFDAEGDVIARHAVPLLSPLKIEKLLQGYVGPLEQIPPMYSAIKINGQPLYKLARKGIEIERQGRIIHIYSLTFIEFKDDVITIDVHCSKGTYIRTLADDIGQALGCGGHVKNLVRTAVAPYDDANMIDILQLEELVQSEGVHALDQFLLPMESSLTKFPVVNLSAASAYYLKSGQSVRVSPVPVPGLVRVLVNNRLVGIGEALADGHVAPKRLFH